MDMYEQDEVWQGVPDPDQSAKFIVDAAKENEFTVVVDREVAGFDVIEMMYMINGVWRVNVEDQDDDEEVPSVILNVTIDRRFNVEQARAAVTKLLENLYAKET
ncbi:MAG: hypothetical protein KF716_25070 [Anaerolineae bacterium]|nr:hypothetical protein [Anaerolineae bacterium]